MMSEGFDLKGGCYMSSLTISVMEGGDALVITPDDIRDHNIKNILDVFAFIKAEGKGRVKLGKYQDAKLCLSGEEEPLGADYLVSDISMAEGAADQSKHLFMLQHPDDKQAKDYPLAEANTSITQASLYNNIATNIQNLLNGPTTKEDSLLSLYYARGCVQQNKGTEFMRDAFLYKNVLFGTFKDEEKKEFLSSYINYGDRISLASLERMLNYKFLSNEYKIRALSLVQWGG